MKRVPLTGQANQNTIMKAPIISSIIAAATYGFLFTACDSPQEDAREEAVEQKADMLEKEAKAVRSDAEAAAEANEKAAENLRKQAEKATDMGKEDAEARADATEENADAIRKEAERKADALEDEADVNREAK